MSSRRDGEIATPEPPSYEPTRGKRGRRLVDVYVFKRWRSNEGYLQDNMGHFLHVQVMLNTFNLFER